MLGRCLRCQQGNLEPEKGPEAAGDRRVNGGTRRRVCTATSGKLHQESEVSQGEHGPPGDLQRVFAVTGHGFFFLCPRGERMPPPKTIPRPPPMDAKACHGLHLYNDILIAGT